VDDDGDVDGPWVTFAKAFTGGAKLFGDRAALEALKLGEQHGIDVYRDVLREEGVDLAVRELIASELMPNQERHLTLISKYLH
jgi:hypothetical protein